VKVGRIEREMAFRERINAGRLGRANEGRVSEGREWQVGRRRG
jgi:hypothetical protein